MPVGLDQAEIDSLMAAARGDLAEEPAADSTALPERPQPPVMAYDFKRPERVTKDQMRSLEGIHESFARNFGAALSGFLRTIIEVRVATIEQLTYSEFIHSLPNPTNFNLLSAPPLEGQMCLEVSPIIIYPIIDRLLGGSHSQLYIPQRPLTSIELGLVRCITDRALQCLTEVWSEMVTVRFEIAAVESNPHLVQIVAPNEVVVVIGFEVRLGQHIGTMSLCIPFKVVEPVMEQLASQGWLAYQRQSSAEPQHEAIGRGLGATHVEVSAFMAETSITLEELIGLQPGDIIQTMKPREGQMILRVRDQNIFAGILGRNKKSRAIKIIRRAEVEEPL